MTAVLRLTAARSAALLVGLAIVLVGTFAYLATLSGRTDGPLDYDHPVAVIGYGSLVLMFPVLGALVASKHPRNAIGWMFCASGLAIGTALCSQLYAELDIYGRDGSLPGGEIAFWLSSWLFPLGLFATPVFLFFLFPTGRAASRSWRWVVRVAIAYVIVGFTCITLTPGPLEPTIFGVENPFGLPGLPGEIVTAVNRFGQIFLPVVFLISLVSFVMRRRSSTGIERQQLKLFGYATTVTVAGFAASFAFVAAGMQAAGDVGFMMGALGLFSLPIAAALAILRHGLYEIDVVINRTLVYGGLTAVLALVYVGLVFALQGILAPFAAESDLAIAASTLAVAALFRPVRGRVQTFIDQRFYRRKFDAQRTLEQFSSHLRDEVDLHSLSSRLIGVVGETMQPTHVSLWLRSRA